MTTETTTMQPPGSVRGDGVCMFCNVGIPDQGAGFLDHVQANPDCRQAYRSWKSNLDLDRPGG